MIYPTLTMLEEKGSAEATTESNKKIYSVTAQGLEFLAANQARIGELFERLEETGRGFERGTLPVPNPIRRLFKPR